MVAPKYIERRAIRIDQHNEHPLYLFTLQADEVMKVAQVSRVGRTQKGNLIGYQRPEVRRHVKGIVDYLDSEEVVFPNSIILAFDSRVSFRKSRGPRVGDGIGEAGILRIPLNGRRPPGWIVDGQQRATALSKASNSSFPVPVNAFIADEISLQRDQFLRVNNTKPLPNGLISELLPEIDSVLPPHLSTRRLPSALVDVLNRDEASPMCGMIRRASTPAAERKGCAIKDTPLITAIEESLTTPSGGLYSYRNLATGETDTEDIRLVLFIYWDAVKRTFPDAWGKPPTKSRLMHGAGIRSMGRVMDHVMRGIDPRARNARSRVLKALAPLVKTCRWTSGTWDDLDGLAWNQIQNIPSHVRLLSSVLVRTVLARRSAR